MSEKEILSHTKRIERRSKIITKIIDRLYLIRFILFFTGFGWLILLPWNGLSRRAWIDENALQPGHVNVDWNWGDVQIADTKLALLEDLWNRNASSVERANFIKSQFQEYGLASNTQFYTFGTPSENITGNNAYGVYRAQRTSGMEAIVIAASWVSRQQEGANLQPNLRGIATVLSLASSLKRRPVWAKDLIFLVSDSYLDGAHAWLSAYHGDIQQ
ncbi:Glycosyl phosphatidyl inositol protein transamidase complex subunit, partial [Serendipita sp. 396]